MQTSVRIVSFISSLDALIFDKLCECKETIEVCVNDSFNLIENFGSFLQIVLMKCLSCTGKFDSCRR